MTALWPRLPVGVAHRLFLSLPDSALIRAQSSHPEQTYAQVGGRIQQADIRQLHDALSGVAAQFGFPTEAPSNGVEFDRRATAAIRSQMDITWSEASSREVWNFVALVALADITEWRWRDQRQRNVERWVATDLTRHTWGRLWWRATAFASAPDLLDRLSESDLNQLLERRVIGGDPALLTAMARSLLDLPESKLPRREIIRDATKRLRRTLAFIETAGLAPTQLQALTDRLIRDSVAGLNLS